MEEMHKTAETYYKSSTQNIQDLAHEFYREMDQNGDGLVSLHEYLAVMKNQGHTDMSNPYFFKKLKKQGNDTEGLTFFEVMTLFYIIQSARPFCDGCGDFIDGMFFTCVECFESKRSTFNVCVDCFQDGKYVHNHKKFMDNFLLLETKRMLGLQEVNAETRQTKTMPAQSSNACRKVVVADPRGRSFGRKFASLALNAAVNYVVQSCSIM